jgi:hypothetical protein
MTEPQVLLISEDGNKSKNVTWSQAKEFFKMNDNELKKLIENGEVKNKFYADYALVWDSKIC